MSVSKLINSSLLLFVDQLVVGAGGWVYWLIISKLASTSEVGLATTVYNLVILIATVVELGLEYPLLQEIVYRSFQGSWNGASFGIIDNVGRNTCSYIYSR